MKRSTIWGVAIIWLIVGVITGYIWSNPKKEVNEVRLTLAKEYSSRAQAYVDSGDTKNALICLDKADSLIILIKK